MRVLVLSDIHSNLEALEACLDAAPAYDQVANLGDVVGYGGNPNEVVERVRTLGGKVIRGNHDRACSGLTSMEHFNAVAAMAVIFTRTLLTLNNKMWLRDLPPGPAQLPGAPEVNLVHGSPLDEDQYLLSLPGALESLRAAPSRIILFGHTHVQGGFAWDGGGTDLLTPSYSSRNRKERFELPLRPSTRYLLNPGSVGQPRDDDWRAAFALLDTEAPRISYFRVPYDVEKAQQRIREAGLPERLAERLSLGH